MATNEYDVCCWGTYDKGKPRVRIMIDGLVQNGLRVKEIHQNVWQGIEDKSTVTLGKILRVLFRIITAYPSLIARGLTEIKGQIVIIPYLGILDIFVMALLVRPFKKILLVYDIFVPLYDGIVNDRGLFGRSNPIAKLLCQLERLAVKISTLSLLDTESHAQYFALLYKVSEAKLKRVFVGAESMFFVKTCRKNKIFNPDCFNVLFYGQFIPLHGVTTIVDAASLVMKQTYPNIKFTLVGTGQQSDYIDNLIVAQSVFNIARITWIEYRDIPDWINESDVVLGIFGESEKAQNVIPNKVFQSLAMNKNTITANTKAMKELLEYAPCPYLHLIPPGNADALSKQIICLYENRTSPKVSYEGVGAGAVGLQLKHHLLSMAGPK